MAYFSSKAFAFLRELGKNNDKQWFGDHQADYEAYLREPALRFITDVGAWFEGEGLPYRAEAKKVGGSLTRIHRDTRFSKDKTPYHTHMTIHFMHAQGSRDKLMPVIGLHVEPDSVGFGAGIYSGATPDLNKVRDTIIASPKEWSKATRGLTLWGDSLKTAPKGYDPEHPMIEDIRRKQFMVETPLTKAQFTGDLASAFQDGVKRILPFNAFLADALR